MKPRGTPISKPAFDALKKLEKKQNKDLLKLGVKLLFFWFIAILVYVIFIVIVLK